MEHAMNAFTREQWLDDITNVLADADSLLSATAEQSGEQIALVRARTAFSLRMARQRMAEMQATLLKSTRKAARQTDTYVHENPWNAMGAAAGAGLLLGFLLGRR